MNKRFLKVKIKSLAEEARIIRLEEKRSRGALRNRLHEHRVGVVRVEARATLLAYAFLRGRAYRQAEPGSRTVPRWDKVESMVKRYGGVVMLDDFHEWKRAGLEDRGLSIPSDQGFDSPPALQ